MPLPASPQSFFYDNKTGTKVIHNAFVPDGLRYKLEAVALHDISGADNLWLVLIYRNARGKEEDVGIPMGNYIEIHRDTIVILTSVFTSWMPTGDLWVDGGDCISVQSAGATNVQMYGEVEKQR